MLDRKGKKVYFSEEQIARETNHFLVQVYGWMSFALIITGLTAYVIANSPQVVNNFIENRVSMFFLIAFELIIVFILVGGINKISVETAVILFILYAILNGFTLSVIFMVFTTSSIASAFFITAGSFAIMSFIGFFTKKDLTDMGNILLMGLIGLVIATFINMHYQSEAIGWISTFVGILIFTGLISYDTQKIKNLAIIGQEGSDTEKKEAIIGALTLYLDFVNLFLEFLKIFGKRR